MKKTTKKVQKTVAKFKKAAKKSIKQARKTVKKVYKKAGTKAVNKATSKIKTVGKKANAKIAASKEAAAKEALCKNQEFLESQKKGYSDPTYDYKAGYPKPDEVWAFDANGNIDKEKSAELAEKMGFWSSIAVGFIPGPLEIVLGKVAGIIVVKVGGKIGSKITSWGATKFGAKGAAKEVTEEATKKVAKKTSEVTGTVWDDIKATQPVVEGTNIPKSFEMTIKGEKIWVNPNATKHMVEYSASKKPYARNLTEQQLLRSLQSASEMALNNGYQYGKVITIDNWQLIFSAPREVGQLPVLYHALYLP
ncbi:hypothetical protein [Listeria innocua]|uniref:hypothetical protein n=1 Tax=Listeria innocua TaxID=1642 RepID=UPI0021ADD7AD|nr:hypothetical protein [Listeria innocua]